MDILVAILAVILVIACVVWDITTSVKKRKQIKSVTDFSRGEWSERALIPCLINKCGIDPRAIYHDLYLRRPDGGYTQIDLAVATPQGIIVFEVKDYSGWIFGNEGSKYWMQILSYGRKKHQFYNPIRQNNLHISALWGLLPNNPDVEIFNVVVFFGNCELKELNYSLTGRTRVIYSGQVAQVVRNIKELELAHYGNKQEVANVLAEGVRNGCDPEIRQAQLNRAIWAKNHGNARHSRRRFFFRIPF